MNLKEALKRIEELEARVKMLEAQPKQEIHYHNYPAVMPPVQPFNPFLTPPTPTPMPWNPPWTVTCGVLGPPISAC